MSIQIWGITQLQETLVDVLIRLRAKQGVPEELILDFDATDDPIRGDQIGKFFECPRSEQHLC